MLTWIQENRNEFLYNFTEIGEDLELAEELREEHKQFEENCGVSINYNSCFVNIQTNDLMGYCLKFYTSQLLISPIAESPPGMLL